MSVVPKHADQPGVSPDDAPGVSSGVSSGVSPDDALAVLRSRASSPTPFELRAWARSNLGATLERVQGLAARPLTIVVGVVAVVAAIVAGLLLQGRGTPPALETSLPRSSAGAAPGATPRAAGVALDSAASASGSPAGAPAATTTTVATTVVVDLQGAVAHPGLVHLAAGARVADALASAGGPTPDADLERLNQAAPLVDGARVFVPRRGQPTVPQAVNGDNPPGAGGASGAGAPAGASGSTVPATPVDLNTASLEQLETLPGVGPSTAQRIIDYRTEHGPFRSVDDLLDVPGIGDAKLAALRSRARV